MGASAPRPNGGTTRPTQGRSRLRAGVGGALCGRLGVQRGGSGRGGGVVVQAAEADQGSERELHPREDQGPGPLRAAQESWGPRPGRVVVAAGDLSPDSGSAARACLKPVGEAGAVGDSRSRPLSAGGPPQRGGCGKEARLPAGGMSWWSGGEGDPRGVSAWAEK